MTDRPETERVDALARALGGLDRGPDGLEYRYTFAIDSIESFAAELDRALTGLGWTVERTEEALDVERWTWAEHLVTVHGPRRRHNSEPCYHRRGDVGDQRRTEDILAEYAALRGGPDATD